MRISAEITDARVVHVNGDVGYKKLVLEVQMPYDDPDIAKSDSFDNVHIDIPVPWNYKLGDRDDLIGKTLYLEIV